jgi:hypothetical protein
MQRRHHDQIDLDRGVIAQGWNGAECAGAEIGRLLRGRIAFGETEVSLLGLYARPVRVRVAADQPEERAR